MSHYARVRPDIRPTGRFWWEDDTIAPWWSTSAELWQRHHNASRQPTAQPPRSTVAPHVAVHIATVLDRIGEWRP